MQQQLPHGQRSPEHRHLAVLLAAHDEHVHGGGLRPWGRVVDGLLELAAGALHPRGTAGPGLVTAHRMAVVVMVVVARRVGGVAQRQ